jgi:hypothetical protein
MEDDLLSDRALIGEVEVLELLAAMATQPVERERIRRSPSHSLASNWCDPVLTAHDYSPSEAAAELNSSRRHPPLSIFLYTRVDLGIDRP